MIRAHLELLAHIGVLSILVEYDSAASTTTQPSVRLASPTTLRVTINNESIDIPLAKPVTRNDISISTVSPSTLSIRIANRERSFISSLADLQDTRQPLSAALLRGVEDVRCRACHKSLRRAVADGEWITAVRDVPSAQWMEMMDWWVCHPDAGAGKAADGWMKYADAVAKAAAPTESVMLVSDESICLHTANVEPLQLLSNSDSNRSDGDNEDEIWTSSSASQDAGCPSCGRRLGRALFVVASEDSEDTKQRDALAYQLSKHRVEFMIADNSEPLRISVLEYVLGQMLGTVFMQSCYRFSVPTLSEPFVLHVLSWQTKMATLSTAATTTTTTTTTSTTQSQLNSELKQVIKIAYWPQSKDAQPDVLDVAIPLDLDDSAGQELIDILQRSTEELPEQLRLHKLTASNEAAIGFLKL